MRVMAAEPVWNRQALGPRTQLDPKNVSPMRVAGKAIQELFSEPRLSCYEHRDSKGYAKVTYSTYILLANNKQKNIWSLVWSRYLLAAACFPRIAL